MLDGKTIGVVIPAFNEELLIGRVLDTMPEFVDRMFVINDASKDRTGEIIDDYASRDARIQPIHHAANAGLGQSLIDGYVAARTERVDVVAVMAGDAQMAPDDLEHVVRPIADGIADYVKGNRLLRDEVIGRMPRHRFIGNNVLTLLTKFATGYWHIIDPQCGYTAISREALAVIPIEKMIKGYGYNADILYLLNMSNFSVLDVEVEPVYGDEKSKIKLKSYVPRVSKLLLFLFMRRIFKKYMVREFHPLFMLYGFAAFNTGFCALMAARFLWLYTKLGVAPSTTLILMMFSFSFAIFSLTFAMWMDMEDNKKLNPRFTLPLRVDLRSHADEAT
jgi:glycosyltransferase involved in cell wall biosynthesis